MLVFFFGLSGGVVCLFLFCCKKQFSYSISLKLHSFLSQTFSPVMGGFFLLLFVWGGFVHLFWFCFLPNDAFSITTGPWAQSSS